MAKNLTVEQKLEVLKTYNVNVEYDKDGAFRVVNYKKEFNIFEIGNAIGDCTMDVSDSYDENGAGTGHIYFICLCEPWGYVGTQKIAREIGNEEIVGICFDDERENIMSVDTIFYKGNLALTEDIKFPEVTISFSDDIGEKALIGMLLLTLFSLKYSLRDKLMSLFYNDNYIEEIYKKQLNKDTKIIMPEMITDIDYTGDRDELLLKDILSSDNIVTYHYNEIIKRIEQLIL